ncbi:hypothetical protein FOA52_015700 [Chlamydomonas sp. UWO 241]|nr:hypothetical protein FOA52_015700 [Chlamydomonas sp. UWO 241]
MDEEEATAAAAERIAAAAEDGTSLPVRLATDVVRFLYGGTGRREPADGGVVSASLLNAKPAVGGIGVEPRGGGVLRVLFTVASDAVADTRTHLLVGSSGIRALQQSRVLLVGLGGVGSFAAEFLVRAGIGHLTIVDGDNVDESNKNRQLPALTSTVGRPKAEVMAERLRDINPALDLLVINEFLDPQRAAELVCRSSSDSSSSSSTVVGDGGRAGTSGTSGDLANGLGSSSSSSSSVAEHGGSAQGSSNGSTQHIGSGGGGDGSSGSSSSNSSSGAEDGGRGDASGTGADHAPGCSYDFVVDCIDTITPKKMIITAARKAGGRVISSMGAGGRVDASRVKVVDLFKTYNDAFAADIRKGLRRMGVTDGVVAVWSDEPVQRSSLALVDQKYKQSYYGTMSYVPALFGLNIASHVIRELLGEPRSSLLAHCENPSVRGYRWADDGTGAAGGSARGKQMFQRAPATGTPGYRVKPVKGRSRTAVAGADGGGAGRTQEQESIKPAAAAAAAAAAALA